MTAQSPKSSEFHLDMLRGIAAFLVVLGHWRLLMFPDYPSLVAPSVSVRLLYFFTGFGRPSVMLFFVLSGYLVTSSALRSLDSGNWSIGYFVTQRLTRLMVVLLPALALCWLWDSVGLAYLPHGLYDGSIHTAAISANLVERRDPWTLVQNGLFLQGITATTYGSNDPLWSLSYEFWYYIFLIPVISIFRRNTLGTRFVSAVGLGFGFWFVGRQITLYFSIWLLGAAVAWLMRSPLRLISPGNRLVAPSSVLLLTATLLLIRAKYLPEGFPGYFILACACSFFIYCAVRTNTKAQPRLLGPVARNAASWSYSLYLLHMPFLVFTASLVIRDQQWQPDLRHVVAAFPLLLAALLYSYLVSLITERYTDVVRHSLAQQVLPSPSAIRLCDSGRSATNFATSKTEVWE
jgi:peptidoglycan/LPS O-acetylase OafA/YrhL